MKFEEQIIQAVPQDDSTALEEKMILYKEIKKLKPLHVIETGTHRGLTSLYMGHALYENKKGHLNTADPFEWGAQQNIDKFPEIQSRVTFHKLRGEDMILTCTDGIDFAFIDGYHEKIEVMTEMRALLPKLVKGAVVYFHDTNGSNDACDVPGAIEELGLDVEYIKTLNGMAKYVHS